MLDIRLILSPRHRRFLSIEHKDFDCLRFLLNRNGTENPLSKKSITPYLLISIDQYGFDYQRLHVLSYPPSTQTPFVRRRWAA